MRNTLILTTILCFVIALSFGQNPPNFGSISDRLIIQGTGTNEILIPFVDDGDLGQNQNITFTATSTNNSVLSFVSATYNAGDRSAIVRVQEHNVIGSVQLTIKATDPNSDFSRIVNVNVGAYDLEGVVYSVHDVVFWQAKDPLDVVAVWRDTLTATHITEPEYPWASIPITVNQDCQTSPPCTGHDFFTSMYKGYLVPPTSGSYTFYIEGTDNRMLKLSTNSNHASATVIASPTVGTNVGNNQMKSASVNLTAGNVYAFYAAFWNIHNFANGIYWEGPGISKQYIPASNIYPTYDTDKPSKPSNLSTFRKGDDFLILRWAPNTSSEKITAYNIYLNGEKLSTSVDTFFQVEGLTANTDYSINISAYDDMGNESSFSNTLTVKTFTIDATAPTPPTTASNLVLSDMAAEIQWSGATDNNDIWGYNVYVNGNLYNDTYVIYDNHIIIKNLNPETNYTIQIETVDAGNNLSATRYTHSLQTLAFDPFAPALGVYKADVILTDQQISRSVGIGYNASYTTEEIYNGTARTLLADTKGASLRWGALGANPMSLSSHSGTGHQYTYGRFMKLCNDLGMYSCIVTGVQAATDWMTNPQTFLNFLEYLQGDGSTTWGAKRIAEGITEPLLTNSKGLVWELGCEVWGGGGLHNAEIGANYSNYSTWCKETKKIIESSPYYDESKIFVASSAREPGPGGSWGLNKLLLSNDSGYVDWLAVGGYLGGNLNYIPEIAPGKSELDYYKEGIRMMAYNLKEHDLQMLEDIAVTGAIKPSYFYETNMTKSEYFGRMGQAIVETDYLASSYEHGNTLPQIFCLEGGEWKITMPAEGWKKLPLYHTSRLFNHHCKGNILKTEVNSQEQVFDANGSLINTEPVSAHFYENEGSYSILLISRDFENDYNVRVKLPLGINFSSSAKLYSVTSTDYSSFDAIVDSTDITFHDEDIVKIPKYGMVLIKFTGDDKNYNLLPLGHFTHVYPTSIEFEKDLTYINSSKTRYNAKVLPEDAFCKDVKWEILMNEPNSTLYRGSTNIIFSKASYCGSNDEMIFKATSLEDPNITNTLTLHMSDFYQLDNCNGIEDVKQVSVRVYPNPANDLLYIDCEGNQNWYLQIKDITGRVVYIQNNIQKGNPISLQNIESGILLLELSNENEKVHKIVIKK